MSASSDFQIASSTPTSGLTRSTRNGFVRNWLSTCERLACGKPARRAHRGRARSRAEFMLAPFPGEGGGRSETSRLFIVVISRLIARARRSGSPGTSSFPLLAREEVDQLHADVREALDVVRVGRTDPLLETAGRPAPAG